MESKSVGSRSSSSSYKSSKGSSDDADSDEDDAAVELEFKRLMAASNEGVIAVSQDPRGRKIAEGFKINWMNMRDAESGALMWESGTWGEQMWKKELKARIPADILHCRAVSREINFSSVEKMEGFKLEQRVFYQGICIE